MARPVKPIDPEEFENLLSFQCTKEDIAGFFHVSEKTLQNYCRKKYRMTFSEVAEEYKAAGRVSIRRAQFAAAKAGNVQMLIHLGKQWLGQTDKVETNISGSISANVKHGDITRVIIYDPKTNEPIKETVKGAEDDVEAYLKDRDNYNGDTTGIYLPNKDPVPEDEVKGERTITSQDGQTRAYIPLNGREIEYKNGKTGAEIRFLDDGRGGYGIEIPDMTIKSGNAVLEDYDDGRGGYGVPVLDEHFSNKDSRSGNDQEIPDRSTMTKKEYKKIVGKTQTEMLEGVIINK